MLLSNEAPRATGLDPLADVLGGRLRAGEDHRDLGTDAGHRFTDCEAVVVSESAVEQHGVRLMVRYGLRRSGGTVRLCDHVVPAGVQALSCGLPEVRVI